MFIALSLTIAGKVHLSGVFLLVCVYGLVKHKETMLIAITQAWRYPEQMLFIAVRNGEWETDNHLFVI